MKEHILKIKNVDIKVLGESEYKNKLQNIILDFDKWSKDQNPIMRKLCYMHLASNIDDSDIKLIPEIFKNLDKDHDG